MKLSDYRKKLTNGAKVYCKPIAKKAIEARWAKYRAEKAKQEKGDSRKAIQVCRSSMINVVFLVNRIRELGH